MKENEQEFKLHVIEQLKQIGVSIVLDGGPHLGQITIHSDKTLESILKDPQGFIAYASGQNVSVSDLVEYKQSEGFCQCSAITKRGTRCKNPVSGWCPHLTIGKFIRLRGGYCSAHGG